MKLKLSINEWKTVLNTIEINASSEKGMREFYSTTDSDLVKKHIQNAVGELDQNDKKLVDETAVKEIEDIQTNILWKNKDKVLESIKLAVELLPHLKKSEIFCSREDCNKLIKIYKNDIAYNQDIYDKMWSLKQKNLMKDIIPTARKHIKNFDSYDEETKNMFCEEYKKELEKDPEIQAGFADLKKEILDRQAILNKLEESLLEASN